MKLWQRYSQKIKTSQLNKVLKEAQITKPPTFAKNKVVKIGYATQVATKPPKFKIFVNKPENVTTSFKRWLENVLRENFDLKGVPLEFEFEEK